jgi:hypothetical protein
MAKDFTPDLRYRGEYSFPVLDLMFELDFGKRRAKPVALIARHMDISKRKVLQLIKQGREEALANGILIMDNGNGSYYLREVDGDGDAEQNKDLPEL